MTTIDAAIDPIGTARELATHANDIEHLQDDMDKLVKDVETIKKSLQVIEQALSEASGGRKVLFASISAAGMIGGLLTWAADKLIK